jgi:large subunit ribosomal protein L19
MDFIQQLERAELKKLSRDLPEFRPGDTLKVYVRVKEGEKERIQLFEGICIDRAHGGMRESFTVRKISFGGIGVERNFPLNSPMIKEIKVARRGKVVRSRLYYLRDRIGKKATKVKEQAIGKRKDKVKVVVPAEATSE